MSEFDKKRFYILTVVSWIVTLILLSPFFFSFLSKANELVKETNSEYITKETKVEIECIITKKEEIKEQIKENKIFWFEDTKVTENINYKVECENDARTFLFSNPKVIIEEGSKYSLKGKSLYTKKKIPEGKTKEAFEKEVVAPVVPLDGTIEIVSVSKV